MVLQALAVSAGNAVDLLRARLHEACNDFYAAAHDGNMHGLDKASRYEAWVLGICTHAF